MKERQATTESDTTAYRQSVTLLTSEIENRFEWHQLTYHQKLELRKRDRQHFESSWFSAHVATVLRYLQILFCLWFRTGAASVETKLANSLFATDYTVKQWLQRCILTGNRLGDLSEIHHLESDLETNPASRKTNPHLNSLQQNVFWPDQRQIITGSQTHKLDDGLISDYLNLYRHARILFPIEQK